MLEIYNDSLNDLLANNPNNHLDIRTQGKSVTVPGLTQVEVKTEDDILHIMDMGEKNRKIASTKMNIERYSEFLHIHKTINITQIAIFYNFIKCINSNAVSEVINISSLVSITLCCLSVIPDSCPVPRLHCHFDVVVQLSLSPHPHLDCGWSRRPLRGHLSRDTDPV